MLIGKPYIQLNTSKRNEDTALAGWLIKVTEETSVVGQYVSTIDIESSGMRSSSEYIQGEERAYSKV